MIQQLNLQYLLITSSYSFTPSIFSPIFSNCYFLMYSFPHLISTSLSLHSHLVIKYPSFSVISSPCHLITLSHSLLSILNHFVIKSPNLPVISSLCHPVSFSQSHCYVSFNRRMSLIIEYLYIFKFEIINIFNIRI